MSGSLLKTTGGDKFELRRLLFKCGATAPTGAMALFVADYGYVLGHGKVIAQGEATELQASDPIRRVYLGEAIAGTTPATRRRPPRS